MALISFSIISVYAEMEHKNSQNNNFAISIHEEYDLKRITGEWNEIMQSYSSKMEKAELTEIVYALESTLLRQVNTYPKHEKEILDAAKSMIKSAGLNWIIFRNKTQLRIRVVPEQEATSKG